MKTQLEIVNIIKHMSKFAKNFLNSLNESTEPKKKLIKEEGEVPLPPPTEHAPEHGHDHADQGDEAAWKASLDQGTDPKSFDTEGNPMIKVDNHGIETAHKWVKKLEEMAEFVNGTGPESLNSQINKLEVQNSIPFRGIVRREEKRMTKLAENCRGLAEVLKSVIITSEKKIKDSTAR